MSRQQRRQPLATTTEQPERAFDTTHRPRQLRGWATVKMLTNELCFSTEDACRSWLRREHIACVKRGRVILVDRLDIEAALRKVSA